MVSFEDVGGGQTGVSGKVVAAGLGLRAAAVVAATRGGSDDDSEDIVEIVEVDPVGTFAQR